MEGGLGFSTNHGEEFQNQYMVRSNFQLLFILQYLETPKLRIIHKADYVIMISQ